MTCCKQSMDFYRKNSETAIFQVNLECALLISSNAWRRTSTPAISNFILPQHLISGITNTSTINGTVIPQPDLLIKLSNLNRFCLPRGEIEMRRSKLEK